MRVLNIQRMSTEDGPGLRTTLFVKGCPLTCAWCHNPESLSDAFQIEWLGERCILCGTCVSVCPEGALELTPEGLSIDRDRCRLCLTCAQACPTLAIESKGQDQTVQELFDELVKDRAYFGREGGVTLSGGEIMNQAGEAALLLQMLKDSGIHTAIDTSGLCTRASLDLVLPWTDLVLYDLKLFDDAGHRHWTGVGNRRILDNFDYLTSQAAKLGFSIWVRTPIIPEATDSDENIRQLARFIGGRADRWELCAFNNLCEDKYSRLGNTWAFAGVPLMTAGRMRELEKLARSEGCPTAYATGNTKLERADNQTVTTNTTKS